MKDEGEERSVREENRDRQIMLDGSGEWL